MIGKHLAMLTSSFVLTSLLCHTDLPGGGQLFSQPRSQVPLSRGGGRTTGTRLLYLTGVDIKLVTKQPRSQAREDE